MQALQGDVEAPSTTAGAEPTSRPSPRLATRLPSAPGVTPVRDSVVETFLGLLRCGALLDSSQFLERAAAKLGPATDAKPGSWAGLGRPRASLHIDDTAP